MLGTDLEAEEASDLVLPEGEKPKERTPQHLTYSAAFVRELHAFVKERLSDAVVRSFARQMEIRIARVCRRRSAHKCHFFLETVAVRLVHRSCGHASSGPAGLAAVTQARLRICVA